MAVSCGQLVKQAWSDNGKSRTFHYKLSIATPPQDIALAVGKTVDAVNWHKSKKVRRNLKKETQLRPSILNSKSTQHAVDKAMKGIAHCFDYKLLCCFCIAGSTAAPNLSLHCE